MKTAIALTLALSCATASAVELNGEDSYNLLQPRGAPFSFQAGLTWNLAGDRVLTLTSGPWESFLDAFAPQHTRQELSVFGYLPMHWNDDWSVDFTGTTLTMTPRDVIRGGEAYGPLVALLVPGFVVDSVPVIPTITAPVPEPEQWALLAFGLALLTVYKRRRA